MIELQVRYLKQTGCSFFCYSTPYEGHGVEKPYSSGDYDLWFTYPMSFTPPPLNARISNGYASEVT